MPKRLLVKPLVKPLDVKKEIEEIKKRLLALEKKIKALLN